MKFNSTFISVFILTLFFISCKNNDSSKNTIAGKWNVTEIIGGFSQPKSYEKENFTWEFDVENKTVTIINTEFLIVDDRKGTIYYTEEGLKIDYGIAFDDIAYIFKR